MPKSKSSGSDAAPKKRKTAKKLRDASGVVIGSQEYERIALKRAETAEYCVREVEYLRYQMERVKINVLDKIEEFLEYAGLAGASNIVSRKGGFCIDTSDGLRRISVQTAEVFTTNEQLQVARRLIDECVADWTHGDAKNPLAILVSTTFRVNKSGAVDVKMLKRLQSETREISDERWRSAMDHINEAIQVQQVKTYYRFSKRESLEHPWITVDLNFNTIQPIARDNK